MPGFEKSAQLQIRVSPAQKSAIRQQAERAGLSISQWVLSRLLPSSQETFQGLVGELATASEPSYAFAELLDFLVALDSEAFEQAVSAPPAAELDAYWANYVAATVEQAASAKQARIPRWTREIAPLDRPVFGSSLRSLRLHLLVASPPAFAARNIFIDSNVGGRV